MREKKKKLRSMVIIDDHPIIRRGFAAYLAETGRFSIAGEAGSLEEARKLFESLPVPPDLALLDIELGSENGLLFLDYLKERQNQKTAVLVYSIFENPFNIQAAIHAGARGYISKSAKEEEIALALEAVFNNKTYIEPKLAMKTAEAPDLYQGLTRREREILSMVQKSYDNHRISRELNLGIRTVENYLTRIYTKTGAQTRGDLARL
jgi:DNA-binding NarL/FixJ family response regulator